MTSFERSEVVRLLNVDDAFLESLERESIVQVDVEGHLFSARMVERVRVAHSLIYELEVNLSGVAVILRMREQLGGIRGTLRRVESILDRQVREGEGESDGDGDGDGD
jgi:hypothetical protein